MNRTATYFVGVACCLGAQTVVVIALRRLLAGWGVAYRGLIASTIAASARRYGFRIGGSR